MKFSNPPTPTGCLGIQFNSHSNYQAKGLISTRLPYTSNVSNIYSAQTAHTSAQLTTNSEIPTTPNLKFDMLLETRLTELKNTLYLADYKDTTRDQSNVRDAYSMVWSIWGVGERRHTSFPALFNAAYPCVHQLKSSPNVIIQEFL